MIYRNCFYVLGRGMVQCLPLLLLPFLELYLVAKVGPLDPSSVLAPSSDARSP